MNTNWFKTGLLLAVLTGLLMVFGRMLGGHHGMIIALGLAVLMNFFSYWFSDRIVLAMYRAQPVTVEENPRLFGIVQALAVQFGIPMPRVYVIPTEAANAFATGRGPRHAAVAATEGILRILNDEELTGVLAHELAHVMNRDVLVSSIAATIAGAIAMLADMARWSMWFGGGRSQDDDRGGSPIGLLVWAIVAPLAAMLIQLAVSRAREFGADQTGGELTKKPLALARALEKIQAAAEQEPLEATPATSHLFIVNPLTGGNLAALFSTHPPVGERIRRLHKMAESLSGYQIPNLIS